MIGRMLITCLVFSAGKGELLRDSIRNMYLKELKRAGGIAMVTLSTSFGLAQGLAMGEAILLLTAFNVTNGLSRLISGYLSDRAGRNLTMTIAFLGAGLAYVLMPYVHDLAAWAILASIVGFAFGTLFAVSGPLVSDCFGLKHFGTIFGLIFTAYGFFSGALGPWLSGHILDSTDGNFKFVFFYLGAGFFLAGLLIWFARPQSSFAQARRTLFVLHHAAVGTRRKGGVSLNHAASA